MTERPDPVVEVRTEGARVVVALHGELDLATAPELDDVLTQHAGAELVVDLEDLTFLDSSGLAVLLRATARRTLALRRPNQLVLRVLETTGVADRFEVVPE